MSDQNWSSQKLPGAGSAPGHPSDVAAMKMHAWMARLIDALRQPTYLRGKEELARSRAHKRPDQSLAPGQLSIKNGAGCSKEIRYKFCRKNVNSKE